MAEAWSRWVRTSAPGTGQKHALGVWEGATENTTVCQGLLTNLQSRDLRTDRSLLVILDGAKALHTAVAQTFGAAAVLQRCQIHKQRNVLEYLPQTQRPWVKAILTRAYAPRRHGRPPAVAGPRPPPGRGPSECRRERPGRARRDAHGHRVRPLRAPAAFAGHNERRREPSQPDAARQAQREALAGRRDIDAQRDDDAVSPHVHAVEQQHGEVELGERGGPPGVEVRLRLGHEPPTHRTPARAMVRRWVAAGVLEATKGFRRVNGGTDMPQLVAALRARDAQLGLGESSEMVA